MQDMALYLLMFFLVGHSVSASSSHQPVIVSQAGYKRINVKTRIWQSAKVKEEAHQDDVSSCGILCLTLESTHNTCKAFHYDADTRRCVTTSQLTVYQCDVVQAGGTPVYVRLALDDTLPYAG